MWAVVPVKCLAEAKQRLAGLLTPDQRYGLSRAMLQDVLTTLSRSADLAGVTLVSPDPGVESLAASFDCEYLSEADLGVAGLNAAMDAAVARLAATGIDDVMIVHGDLPMFDSEELSSLLRAHVSSAEATVTIVTDRHGIGSNCVIVGPVSRLKFCFGHDSLRRHVAQAREKGMIARVERLPGASLDIDTPDDLRQLLAVTDLKRAQHTHRYIASIGLCVPLASVTDRFPNSMRAPQSLNLSE